MLLTLLGICAASDVGGVHETEVEELLVQMVPVASPKEYVMVCVKDVEARVTVMVPAEPIVVAGMEGALASVVGGLVDKPVIAVPTSIGYGANLGGLSALLSMLNSCANGVGIVNIDNGFGAGYLAANINRINTEA